MNLWLIWYVYLDRPILPDGSRLMVASVLSILGNSTQKLVQPCAAVLTVLRHSEAALIQKIK